MKIDPRRALAALWYGAALASLFFMPLIQALQTGIVYLFWQGRDTAELAIAFAGLTLLFGAAWYALDRAAGAPRLQVAGLTLLGAIPLASFGTIILRQLVDVSSARTIPPVVLLMLAIVLGTIGLATVVSIPALSLRALRGTALLLSPVTLIMLAAFVQLARYPGTPAAYSTPQQATGSDSRDSTARPSVYVFLFDELSYRFMYQDGAVRRDLPHLRWLSERATNYHGAQAPGDETAASIPGLLAGRDLSGVWLSGDEVLEILPDGKRLPLNLQTRDSLFARARANGFRTEMVGFYLPYCRLLSGVADACQSFSWYNMSAGAETFSPIHAILTNVGLWPYEWPFGMLKVPVLCLLERRIVDRTAAAAVVDPRASRRRFRFVHFSVPHHPFVFDRDGYNPPADPMQKSAENYERQLRYVDTLAGMLIDRLEQADVFDGSTLVVMSDHEFRWAQLVEADKAHIPLIIKRPGQRSREDVTEPVKANAVLEQLVAGR